MITISDTLPSGLTYNADKTLITVSTAFKGKSIDLSNYSTVKIIDATSFTKAVNIFGNSLANSIVGGKKADSLSGSKGKDTLIGSNGADTLVGGKGKDLLIGGNGKDVFLYASGDGNDTITDYEADKDKIKLTSGTVDSSSLDGSNVILKVDTGSITLVEAVNKSISVLDNRNKTVSFIHGSNVKDTITGISYDDNGNAVVDKIFGEGGADLIDGGAGADWIDGGKGKDTLIGGKGKDTLTGGAGNDVFVYANGDGNDVIIDYTPDQDIIKLTNASISSSSINGEDVILKIGKGSICIKNGKDKQITVVDKDNQTTTQKYGSTITAVETDTGTLPAGLSYNADKTKITATGTSFINLTRYASTVTVVDASAMTSLVSIFGNSLDNSIVGGSNGNDLSGGLGNDTLTGGKSDDTFIYTAGNDVITNYTSIDTILLESGNTITASSISGNDVILTISNSSLGGGTLTIKNGKSKEMSFNQYDTNSNMKTWKSVYYNASEYNKGTVILDDSISGSRFDLDFYRSQGAPQNIDVSATYKSYLTINGDFRDNVIRGANTNDSYGYAYLNGGYGNDTIYGGTTPGEINGGSGDDVIYAGSNGGNLNGGSGNNTIYGGNGNDIFEWQTYSYEEPSNNVIYNYAIGNDTIQWFGSLSSDGKIIDSYKISGNDIILTSGNSNMTVKGISKPEDLSVSMNYSNFIDTSWYDGTNIASTTSVSISGDTVILKDTFTRSYFNLNSSYPQNVDASAIDNKSMSIYGDDRDNVIRGGSGSRNYLNGEGGNDTLYGHDGTKDEFRFNYYNSYYKGNNVIYNYNKDEDYIRLDGHYVPDGKIISNYKVSGNDIVLTVAGDISVNITVKGITNPADLTIKNFHQTDYRTWYSSDQNDTYWYNGQPPKGVTYSNDTVILTDDLEGNQFELAYYAKQGAPKNIDVSAMTEHVDIYGDDRNNIIRAGGKKSGNYFYGGAGNDTLYGASYTEDTTNSSRYSWRYNHLYGDDGDDVIYGGKGSDNHLNGGAGNNTLYGGDDTVGSNTFYWSNTTGENTIIYNYSKDRDVIIWSGDVASDGKIVESYNVTGNDIILTSGNSTLTVKDITNVADLSIENPSGQVDTYWYNGELPAGITFDITKAKSYTERDDFINVNEIIATENSIVNATDDMWFVQDDNYIRDELKTILDTKSEVLIKESHNDYEHFVKDYDFKLAQNQE